MRTLLLAFCVLLISACSFSPRNAPSPPEDSVTIIDNTCSDSPCHVRIQCADDPNWCGKVKALQEANGNPREYNGKAACLPRFYFEGEIDNVAIALNKACDSAGTGNEKLYALTGEKGAPAVR